MLKASDEEFSRLENDIIKGKHSLVFRKCAECSRKMQVNYYASIGLVMKAMCSDCGSDGCAEVTVSVKAFLNKVFDNMAGRS